MRRFEGTNKAILWQGTMGGATGTILSSSRKR
jgi:hypothetical protein